MAKVTTRVIKGRKVAHTAAGWKAYDAKRAPKKPVDPYAAPMYQPTQVVSGKPLAEMAKTIADLQIAPQKAALETGMSEARRQGSFLAARSGDYYKQLATEEQKNVDTQKAIAARTDTQLGQINDQHAGQLRQAGQDAQQHLPQDQAISAAGREALAQTIAQGEGQQAAQAGAYKSAGALQGGNYQSFASQSAANAQLHGAEAQSAIGGRTQSALTDAQSKLTALLGSRGATEASTLQNLRKTEFDKYATLVGLSNAQSATDAKKYIAQLQAAQSDTNNQRTTSTSAANNANTVSQSDINNQRTTSTSAANNALTNATSTANNAATNKQSDINNRRTIAAQGKKSPALTPDQNNQFTKGINNAYATLSRLRSSKDAASRNRRKAYNYLTKPKKNKGAGLDATHAQAAIDLFFGKYLSAGTANTLKLMGYSIPKAWIGKKITSTGLAGILGNTR